MSIDAGLLLLWALRPLTPYGLAMGRDNMQWKFWKKDGTDAGDIHSADAKMPGPRQLPQQIGGYLVIREKLDPDWVWSLRCVVRRYPERKAQFDFRVYNPVDARQNGIKIIGFKSLDDHPELILYQGFYNKYIPEAQFIKAETENNAA
jgi:hypothetical protein